MIKDLAGRFSGQRNFIEDLENLIPEFYDRIGQNLRPWTPPPPSIDKHDPIQDDSIPEDDGAKATSESNHGLVPPSDEGLTHDHDKHETAIDNAVDNA